MIEFKISSLSNELDKELREKIDNKSKAIGSLGKLEDIAFRLGKIQNCLTPVIKNPSVVVFAGDHGIANDGVSFYPKSVTYQMLYNYLKGGAAATVFAKQHSIQFHVVDAGVDHDFHPDLPIINRKLGYGTKNYRLEPAMTKQQCMEGIKRGAKIVEQIHQKGCNFIIFGEKGIGNTSSASLILSLLGNVSLQDCVGRGTGLNQEGVNAKFKLLNEALSRYKKGKHPIDVLTHFGGFEIVMLVGAILKAAELKMLVLIDGFIITSALLAAFKIEPKAIEYCLFAHQSNEKAHRKMLEILNAEPILDIGMRLGEATGAMLCFPLIKSATQFLNKMSSWSKTEI